MKNQFNILTMVLCAGLLGCGSGSYANGGGSPPVTSYATMQAGQWEFVATPTNGQPVFVEANLTVSGSSATSSLVNTALFQQNVGVSIANASHCVLLTANGSMSNGILSGTLMSNSVSANFSGATIASDGKSVSGGTYNSPTLCGLTVSQSSGTFTGYAVGPLTGTFKGTITGLTQTGQITINVTQDSNFGITGSGAFVQPGFTTTLAFSPNSSLNSNDIVGATMGAFGTATNVNGSSGFNIFGHFNPAGTQIVVAAQIQADTEIGTLTKQ